MSKYYSDLKRKQTIVDFSPLQHRISCLASHQVATMDLFSVINNLLCKDMSVATEVEKSFRPRPHKKIPKKFGILYYFLTSNIGHLISYIILQSSMALITLINLRCLFCQQVLLNLHELVCSIQIKFLRCQWLIKALTINVH